MAIKRVEFPAFREAWEAIKEAHADSGSDCNPMNMFLLGVSGVGKSFLLRQYEAAHPKIHTDELTVIPVLFITIPSSPTRRGIYVAFLEGLGQDGSRGSTAQLQRRAKILCQKVGVEIIFIDEIQHFLDRGQAHAHAAAADTLKEMLDLLGRPAVFSGAPRSRILFNHNSQLRSRIMTTIRLWPFDLNQILPLRGFVHALTADFPEASRQWLSSDEVATRIFFATDGIHRNIAGLLKLISKSSANNVAPDFACLKKVFERKWSPSDATLNPFHERFPMRRLNLQGEPFMPTYLDGDDHADFFHPTGTATYETV